MDFRIMAVLVGAIVLSACGGGGGGASAPPAYSISVNPTSVSFSNGVTGNTYSQSVAVTFVGAGAVVGTLPGQTLPPWLSVTVGAQGVNSVMISLAATTNVAGDYQTTLRFVTGSAAATNTVYVDVPVSFHVVPGTAVTLSLSGLVSGSTVAFSLNNSAPVSETVDNIFNIGNPIAVGTTYTIAITTQPRGQMCTFDGGATSLSPVSPPSPQNLAVTCNASLAQWTWQGGSMAINATPVYGTEGTPSTANTPGARSQATYASDKSGNLWFFGGVDSANGFYNDLWKYNPTAGTWTWISGSSTVNDLGNYGTQGTSAPSNVPGARTAGAAWIDAAGNFWLFGGEGFTPSGTAGELNDLWMFDVSTGAWTWIGGSNTLYANGVYGTRLVPSVSNIPGSRELSSYGVDSAGNFWLFGGFSPNFQNDLWTFNPTARTWTWVSGSNTQNAAGVYGTKGTPSASNVPGARIRSALWLDPTGTAWLFGGYNQVGDMNDLWSYSPSSDEWTWVAGANTINAAGNYAAAPGTSTSNEPSARSDAAYWLDHAGDLWLMGGNGIDSTQLSSGVLSDLWKFDRTLGSWAWISGTNSRHAPAVFGTQGTGSVTNSPGGRASEAAWVDVAGNLWLFGGSSLAGLVNDVWEVAPP